MENALLPTLAFVALALPFAAAATAPTLTRFFGHNAAWVLVFFPLAAFACLASFIGDVSNGILAVGGFDWAASLGLRLTIRIDGLSLVFGLLITGIGALIVLYSGSYLKGDPGQGRFFAFILLFMGSMQGLVLSDNLLMLFVFWELTSITSFLLIGYSHKSESSRRAALQALAVTGGGGLVLLAGLLVLMNVTGATDLHTLLELNRPDIANPALILPMVLIIIGAFTKSAQFPFHFWLPNAMQAPTPVSAYLHSATMVKAGVYLLMRFNPVFGAMPEWQIILPVFGGATLILGATMALRHTDLKLMLAYTTVASLGLMVMLTGMGSELAVEGAVLYLMAHALFKGCLFMVAGVIDHEAGSRDILKLGGLRRAMPLTFAAGLLAALSMGGLPLFLGFQAKEEIYAALADPASQAFVYLVAAVLGNAMMFATAFTVGLKPFIGEKSEAAAQAHDGPALLMAGPLVLALCGVAAVAATGLTHHYFTSPMASSVWGHAVVVAIDITPHWGLPLALSLVTVALGLAIYNLMIPLRALVLRIETTVGWGPDRGFDQFMTGLVHASARLTQIVQPGRLEIYMTVTFITLAVVLLGAPAWSGEWPSLTLGWPDLHFYEAAFLLIVAIGLFQVIAARTRVVAIISLGVQGFAVAVLYLLFGAPDLSFTQFMVETLSVVILALVMTRLRLGEVDHRGLLSTLGDGVIALACGTGFMLLLLKTMEVPFDRTLTDFFSQFSKTMAHGANVVNVIIVDFRGTDTLGEIAVVVITGLAILALIRLRPARFKPADNNPDIDQER